MTFAIEVISLELKATQHSAKNRRSRTSASSSASDGSASLGSCGRRDLHRNEGWPGHGLGPLIGPHDLAETFRPRELE